MQTEVRRAAARRSRRRTDGRVQPRGARDSGHRRAALRQLRDVDARGEARLRARDLGGAVRIGVRAEHLDRLDARRDARRAEREALGPEPDGDPIEPTAPDRAERCVAQLHLHAREVEGAVHADRQRREAHRRRADEAGDEVVHGRVVELARRGALLQPAVAEDGDAVPERHRLGLVVRHVDGRRRRAPTAAPRCRRASARAAARRGSRAARPSGRPAASG